VLMERKAGQDGGSGAHAWRLGSDALPLEGQHGGLDEFEAKGRSSSRTRTSS
jgi:hypothetical protein